MKVLVSGASGLIGSALTPLLSAAGEDVFRLVRREPGEKEIEWSPAENRLDGSHLEGIGAVVHLAGENIAGGRWSESQKARIRESRVNSTRLLAETLANLEQPPQVLVCASAIGFYGDRGEEELDESSPPGTGFLADVCQQWEAAAEPARQKGIRVVHLRFGMVLSAEGGALTQMLRPFKLGLGGIVGDGRQYWSWVSRDDLVGAIHHALVREELSGPVNVVSPYPVRNREFTKILGRVLRRPTIFPLPAFMARLMLGQMADELLLASARVQPRRLQETGYTFRHAELEPALRHILASSP